VNITTRTGHG